ncbi:hypothetical protein Q3G72_022354 [Acer saccharum]|nr:hypothetical protein Q3G72_022354 [Acer saccharum]
MDMSNFRPDSHVAQQSRRDKLRIQQCSASVQHLEDYTHNLGQQSSANPDLIQVRNVRNANLLYDLSSEIISFSANPDVLSAQRNAMLHQELSAAQQHNRSLMGGDDLFTNLPHSVSSHHFNGSSRTSGDFQSCGNWKSLDSQTNSDWMVNYASGSAGRESNQNQMLVGEVMSNNNVKASNISSSRKYLKPNNNYNEYHQYVQSTLTNPSSGISSQDRQQKHFGDMHYANSLYQNNVNDVVTLASLGTQGLEVASLVQQNTRETGHGTWTDSGNELVLLPNYANQSSDLRYDSANTWMNRSEEGCHQWNAESGFVTRKSGLELRNVASDVTTQGLSLSLSSNPPSKMHVANQLGDRYESQDPHSRTEVFKEPQDSKAPKPSIISKGCGKSLQELVGTTNYNIHRGGGPLGPFTGYATILKSSRFSKPAQELLDGFCSITGSKLVKTFDASERLSGDQVSASVSASADGDAVDAADKEVGAKGNNSSVVSSSTFYSSNQISCDGVGVGSSSSEPYRPEYQQKKAKLLYLQEEVCRRYKLYYQQMQMVVSSFESVAGLSASTPYVSLALKTVSKNFRCLKNTISNQLKNVSKALGEDLLSSPSGTSTSKGDTNTSRLKYADQGFQRHKSSGSNVGFLEPQQHIWRPQRGLPERSVAILRAWLFDHFLHPYPTDTDKHMLATQTGLSRNQVSNWFINARVRVWKPMVEEIHMLETKGTAETNQNSSKSDGKSTASEGTGRSSGDQPMNKLGISSMSDEHLDYSGIGSSAGTDEGLIGAEQWNQEKRSRVECQVTTNMDRSFMRFMPYQRGGLEVGGLGAVSLTLGLRHGVESSQQQQQQQQQTDHHQLRQQLGGQMIHDFVG